MSVLKMAMVLVRCCLLGLLCTGCASTEWAITMGKEAELVWPPQPYPAKVKYLGEMTGVNPEGGSFVSFMAGKNSIGVFTKPVDIAVGLDNRMAIVDSMKNGVHFFVPELKQYKFIYKTDDEFFSSPVSVTFDDGLNLYVTDSALKRIFIFNDKGEYRNTIQAHGLSTFGRPTGINYNNDLLYIVDTAFHKIHVYNSQGRFQFSFGGRGVEDGQFNIPTHIAMDSMGNIYVNDAMNFRIQKFDGRGNFINKFGHHGDGSGDFSMPKGVAVDRWGVVYVIDTLFDNLQLFDQQGGLLLAVGSQGSLPGEFWMPSGLFIDHNDRLYVCDTYNHRIQVFQLFSRNPDQSPEENALDQPVSVQEPLEPAGSRENGK